jgi:hypothetical protein
MARVGLGSVLHDLDECVATGALTDAERSAVEGCAKDAMPAVAEIGLVHYDVAPENIVRLDAGGLRLVDLESVTVGPLDLDVARACERWALTPAQSQVFERGYERLRSLALLHRHHRFWRLRSLLASLRFAQRERPAEGGELRRRLLDVAGASTPKGWGASRTSLGFGGLNRTVRVRAEREDLRWLQEFVDPWMVSSRDEPDWTIEVLPPTGRLLLDREPRGRVVTTFTMDKTGGDTHSASFWQGAGTLDHPERNLRLHVAPPHVFIEATDQGVARMTLLRVVRELTLHAAGVCLHASAFVLSGVGVVVCGPKNAGKTTLLLQALGEGAEYVTNDRLVVHQSEAGHLQLHGIPTVVSIRAGGIDRVPPAAARFRARPLWYKRTEAECDRWVAAEGPAVIDADAQWFSSRQLCSTFAVRARAAVSPDILLFPAIDPLANGLVATAVSADEARHRLCSSVLGRGGVPEAFRRGAASAEVSSHSLSALAAIAPAYHVAVGPDAWIQPGAVGRLLRRLRGERSEP